MPESKRPTPDSMEFTLTEGREKGKQGQPLEEPEEIKRENNHGTVEQAESAEIENEIDANLEAAEAIAKDIATEAELLESGINTAKKEKLKQKLQYIATAVATAASGVTAFAGGTQGAAVYEIANQLGLVESGGRFEAMVSNPNMTYVALAGAVASLVGAVRLSFSNEIKYGIAKRELETLTEAKKKGTSLRKAASYISNKRTRKALNV